MRLGLVNDFLPEQRPGGASRAIRLLMEEGEQRYSQRQVQAVFCTPGNFDTTCDFYVSFLTKRFSETEMSILQARPYIECGFDWWPDEDGNSKWRNLMYEKARMTVFVSPLHYQRFCSLYCVEPRRSLVLPPPLSISEFNNVEIPEERQGALWASEWHAAKGPDLAGVIARKMQIHLDMYSPSMPAEIAQRPTVFTPFAHPKGFVPDEGWYNTMAKYKTFLHTPRVPDAFGYAPLEAYILGLETLVTGRTGLESYGRSMDEMAQRCFGAAAEFWDNAETVF